jgi:hypothetical protein
LIEHFLAVLEMILKFVLRHPCLFRDPGDRVLIIAGPTDYLGSSVNILRLVHARRSKRLSFVTLLEGSYGPLRHALAPSSLRSTRLSTLPNGLCGRASK